MAESENMTTSSPGKPWSETRTGHIAVAAGILALFVLVFWLAMKSRQMLASPVTLVVDEQYLSFGDVWEDPAFIWTLPIRNTTNETVEIIGFVADCPCGKIEPPSLEIPAHGTKEIRVTLNLRIPYNGTGTQKIHPTDDLSEKSVNEKHLNRFSIKLAPVFPNRLDRREVWTITGQVRRAGILAPNEVYFGDTLARGMSNVKKKVVLQSKAPVHEVVATCDSTVAKLEVKRQKGNPEKYDIIVNPMMDMKAGPFKGEGKIQLILDSGEQPPPLLLPISGVLLEDIQVKQSPILLGVATIGTTVDESILIYSASDSQFELEQVDVPAGSKLQVVRQISNGAKQVKLTQEITHRGDQRVSLRFRVRHRRSEPATEILVPVVYYGVDPHP